MAVLVSICVPCYKNIALLTKCLSSVLEQTFTDYELIISDDTPDTSIENFLKLFLNDKVYTYHRNAQALGSPENWNKAISLANGIYIKVLHHDDYFSSKHSLQKFIDIALQNTTASFLFCDCKVELEKTEANYEHNITNTQLKRLQQQPEFLFFRNCIGAPSSTFYKREVLLNYNKSYKWLVDVEFYIRFLKQAPNFCVIREALITTFSGAKGQITGQVINDKHIIISEHLNLFSAIYNKQLNTTKSKEFFYELFERFNIKDFNSLQNEFQISEILIPFLKDVFIESEKLIWWKKIKKRLLTSRYNKRTFKLERF
jgi:glycosyltransferase involved in cell wall biosynthesis